MLAREADDHHMPPDLMPPSPLLMLDAVCRMCAASMPLSGRANLGLTCREVCVYRRGCSWDIHPTLAASGAHGESNILGYWTEEDMNTLYDVPIRRSKKLAASLLGVLSMSACGIKPMGYRWPVEWNTIVMPTKEKSSSLDMARYQIAECERIEAAYNERAQNRSRRGLALSITGGAAGGVGAILAAIGGLTPEDSRTATTNGVLIIGAALTLVGAVLTAANLAAGSDRTEPYKDAGKDVRDGVGDFRSYLNDNETGQKDLKDVNKVEDRFGEQICLLRERCRRPRFETSPVGVPWWDKHVEPPGKAAMKRLSEDIEQLCSQYGAVALPPPS